MRGTGSDGRVVHSCGDGWMEDWRLAHGMVVRGRDDNLMLTGMQWARASMRWAWDRQKKCQHRNDRPGDVQQSVPLAGDLKV